MTVAGAYGWTEYDFFIVLVEERFLLYIEFHGNRSFLGCIS